MLLNWTTPRHRNIVFAQSGIVRAYTGKASQLFTDDFIFAATSNTRCPKALVEVTWADTLIDFNLVISSNDINRIDRTGQIFNGKTESGEKWAYIHDGLIADGSFHVCPELDVEPQMGWYGSALIADGAGDFSTKPYLTLTHDARPYSKIVVAGDSIYNEYPVDFDITITHPGGPTVINVTGNTERIYENLFNIIVDVTSVKLEVSKWSAPNTIVKITQFIGATIVLYDSSDIVELGILEETNSDTGVVPIGNVSANELDLSLLNTDRRFSQGNTESVYHEVLLSGRKIRVWLGFVLPSGSLDATGDVEGYIVKIENGVKVGYMPYGVYWSKDWISSHDSQITTTTAYDIAYKLSQKDFLRSDNYSGNVGDIVNEAMTEALRDIPDLKWRVSADIAALTWGEVAFKTESYLEVLKDISEATLSYTYVDRSGILVIGSLLGANTPVQAWQQIGLSEYFDYESNPKIDELINFIRVGYIKYNVGTPDTDIYPDSETFVIPAGGTLGLYLAWNQKPVDISTVVINLNIVSGSPYLSDHTIYANGADIVITGAPGDEVSLSVSGTPYALEENTETTASDTISINRYGTREFALTGNVLVTTIEQAQGLADNLIVFYGNLRNDGAFNWFGSTLIAVGDTLEVAEFKSETVETKTDFIIKRQTTKFDGGIQVETELRRA